MRCQRLRLVVVLVELPAADAVTNVHIDHSPRRKYGLLIRVPEPSEYSGNLLHPSHRRELVCGADKVTVVLADCPEHIRIVIWDKFLKKFLGDFLRHKLLPGLVVDEIRKIPERDFLLIFF